MAKISRIGKKPIAIPERVNVSIQGKLIVVSGPKGELSMNLPPGVSVETGGGYVRVAGGSSPNHGKVRAQVSNMIDGAAVGWTKILEIVGTGFRASTDSQTLTLNLGFSHPVVVQAPEGITFSVAQNKVTVSGVDKQLVGQVAQNIRQFRKPEPYKGKGIKYEGEFIRKKAGKAAKGATTA